MWLLTDHQYYVIVKCFRLFQWQVVITFFLIFKQLISFHMITQSVFYQNKRVSSNLKLHTLTIDISKKKKH
jgi:hypothetical protein